MYLLFKLCVLTQYIRDMGTSEVLWLLMLASTQVTSGRLGPLGFLSAAWFFCKRSSTAWSCCCLLTFQLMVHVTFSSEVTNSLHSDAWVTQ